MRLLLERHSVPYTFSSAFLLLQEFAGLFEISCVALHPDDVRNLGSQRNSTVLLELLYGADLEPDCLALPLSNLCTWEMGLVRD